MGFVLGESRGRKPCVFPCKVAPAGDERYLVCAAGAAAVEPSANRFLLCVLQRVVVHVCVVLCVSWLSGCRSQCNGCMIVVVLSCHVRREMRVGNLKLPSLDAHGNTRDAGWELEVAKRVVMAAWMLHGLRFGGKPGAGNLVFFRVKWLRPAMKGIPRVCGGCGCGRTKRELVPPLCSATSGCSCVRSSMRFLTLWLQIAV